MIAPGRHIAICRSIQFGTTSTEKPQIAVEFEIRGDTEDAGASITWFGFFTEKTTKRTVESLRHLGWEGDDLAELPALAEAGQLATEVELVVDHEEYNGNTSAKVRWVNRIGGGRLQLEKPMEGRDLAAFAASMKASVRGVGSRGNGAARPPGGGSRPGGKQPDYDRHPNAPNGDREDDLPF